MCLFEFKAALSKQLLVEMLYFRAFQNDTLIVQTGSFDATPLMNLAGDSYWVDGKTTVAYLPPVFTPCALLLHLIVCFVLLTFTLLHSTVRSGTNKFAFNFTLRPNPNYVGDSDGYIQGFAGVVMPVPTHTNDLRAIATAILHAGTHKLITIGLIVDNYRQSRYLWRSLCEGRHL